MLHQAVALKYLDFYGGNGHTDVCGCQIAESAASVKEFCGYSPRASRQDMPCSFTVEMTL